jgi:hypothetical protein
VVLTPFSSDGRELSRQRTIVRNQNFVLSLADQSLSCPVRVSMDVCMSFHVDGSRPCQKRVGLFSEICSCLNNLRKNEASSTSLEIHFEQDVRGCSPLESISHERW